MPTQFQTIFLASTDTPNVGDLTETKLTERHQKIQNLIKESPIIIDKQMSEILSVSQRTIERNISALQEMKFLSTMEKIMMGCEWYLAHIKLSNKSKR